MKINLRTTVFTVATFALTLALAAPASAQRQRGESRGSQQSESRRAVPAQRGSQPGPSRAESSRQAQQAPRQVEQQRAQPARPSEAQRPIFGRPQADRPSEVRPQASRPGYEAPRYSQPQAVPRQGSRPNVYRNDDNFRYQSSRPGGYVQRSYTRPQTFYYGGYSHGYTPVRRPVFVQPYYSFRPRFSIGFGISIGYGVAYPWQYYDPYGRYNYGLGAFPRYDWGRTGYGYFYNRVGGISFNIDPYDADVFIDGQYVGVADDFSPGQMPLTLLAGRHRIDLRADGFEPVSFQITIVAGQVIPYAGTLPY